MARKRNPPRAAGPRPINRPTTSTTSNDQAQSTSPVLPATGCSEEFIELILAIVRLFLVATFAASRYGLAPFSMAVERATVREGLQTIAEELKDISAQAEASNNRDTPTPSNRDLDG